MRSLCRSTCRVSEQADNEPVASTQRSALSVSTLLALLLHEACLCGRVEIVVGSPGTDDRSAGCLAPLSDHVTAQRALVMLLYVRRKGGFDS